MVPPSVQEEVRKRLQQAELEHDVRVLFAVESGSRAWGFASRNSDYDARFIYVHRPDWYLSVDLEEHRDVIEQPIENDLDVNGWDVRKALRLFWKSNPGFVEWIQSPIVYKHFGSFQTRALELLPKIYSVESGIYHYRSMAKTNFRGYLQDTLVPLKKYFYVLRPLLAVRWLEQFGKPAPMEFDRLLCLIDREVDLLSAINDLLVLKRQTLEMGLAPQVPLIQQFIERELDRLEGIKPTKSEQHNLVHELSALFRAVLDEAWADRSG